MSSSLPHPPHGCLTTLADVNGDGRDDLISAPNNQAAIDVLLNTSLLGAPSFAPAGTFAGGTGNELISGDLDNDGDDDLVAWTAGGSIATITVSLGDPVAVLQPTAPQSLNLFPGGTYIGGIGGSRWPQLDDVNGDGLLDLHVFVWRATGQLCPIWTLSS